MIELSRSGRFMLVGDSIISLENLATVETEETVSDIAEAVEDASGDNLSDMFRDIKQKVTTSVVFGVDGGGGRKVIKVTASELEKRGIANKQLSELWEILKDRA